MISLVDLEPDFCLGDIGPRIRYPQVECLLPRELASLQRSRGGAPRSLIGAIINSSDTCHDHECEVLVPY